MYTSACICDLPCKNDLWDGSAQEYNKGSIAHTWSHKETIAAEDLLALSKPQGAISARLHPAGNLLYWHSATQVSCIHIHRTMIDIRSSAWVQCHHKYCELWPIFPGEPLTGRFLWSAAWSNYQLDLVPKPTHLRFRLCANAMRKFWNAACHLSSSEPFRATTSSNDFLSGSKIEPITYIIKIRYLTP